MPETGTAKSNSHLLVEDERGENTISVEDYLEILIQSMGLFFLCIFQSKINDDPLYRDPDYSRDGCLQS